MTNDRKGWSVCEMKDPSMSDIYMLNAFEAAQSPQLRFKGRLQAGKICCCSPTLPSSPFPSSSPLFSSPFSSSSSLSSSSPSPLLLSAPPSSLPSLPPLRPVLLPPLSFSSSLLTFFFYAPSLHTILCIFVVFLLALKLWISLNEFRS